MSDGLWLFGKVYNFNKDAFTEQGSYMGDKSNSGLRI